MLVINPINQSYKFLLISLMHKMNAMSQQLFVLWCVICILPKFFVSYIRVSTKWNMIELLLLIFLLPSAFIKITTWRRILTCNIYSTATLLWNVIYNVLCKLHCKRTDVYTKTIIISGFHNHKWYNMKASRKLISTSNLI